MDIILPLHIRTKCEYIFTEVMTHACDFNGGSHKLWVMTIIENITINIRYHI